MGEKRKENPSYFGLKKSCQEVGSPHKSDPGFCKSRKKEKEKSKQSLFPS